MDTGTLMRARITIGSMVLSVVLVLGLPVGASAIVPPAITSEAKAANAAFLAYAPRPPTAGAMCLVDTGVNDVPDTGPTLVYATALDGGSPSDSDPEGHGTLMTMLAGGQGHGLRGIWPQIRIVSIRATSTPAPGHAPSYQYANYVEALKKCLEHSSLNIKTVNLSLSSTIPPTPDQAQQFAQALNELVARGIAVVAAAGNAPGEVQYPGAEPGVLSVGAGTNTGGTCSFSASEKVGIFAPGCEVEFADPITDNFAPDEYVQGTSDASVITAAALTALVSYAPTLTLAQAENLLVTTAVAGHLNVAGAFEAAGLGSIVAAGNAAIPQEPQSPPTGNVAGTTVTGVPKASVRGVAFKHGILTVRLRTLPKGAVAHLQALCLARKPGKAVSVTTTLRLRCSRPSHIEVWITEGGVASVPSRVTLRLHTVTSQPRARRAENLA